jgi:tetratricopeptide (TPR) repeat protein
MIYYPMQKALNEKLSTGCNSNPRCQPAFKTAMLKYGLAVSISLLTFIIYLPSLRNEFVNWDDDAYVYINPNIRSFDSAFFNWAFSNFYSNNWHPLTWISHALDYAIWGLNPMGHHLTNNILHVINTLLVVLLVVKLFEAVRSVSAHNSPHPPVSLRGGTEDTGVISGTPALITAATTGLLFGLHPIHVESVAWVSERKDLLCATFFLLSVMVYMQFITPSSPSIGKRGWRSRRNYILSLLFFALALMSKPMAVSLPFVLLILDWYPFERIKSVRTFITAIAEKLPFIALTLVSSVLTILAQKSGGAMSMMGFLPLSARMLVAVKSLIEYLWKMIFPYDLSPYYPYPSNFSLFSREFFPAILIASCITVLCLYFIRKQKALPALWGYYVATLIPVLGIIQVGGQSMADRYAYLPSLGPFILIGLATAWLFGILRSRNKGGNILTLCGLAAALSLVFGISYLTVAQISVWEDSIHLWSFVIKKEPDRVALAYYNRGNVLIDEGRFHEAVEDFNKAIALRGDYYEYIGRGTAFWELGQLDKALTDFDKAISVNPFFRTYYTRGIFFDTIGKSEKAIIDYNQAITQNPAYVEAIIRLGILYGKLGSIDRAIDNFDRAIAVSPDYAVAYANRGFAYSLLGQYDKAIGDLTIAIALNKNDGSAYFNRGNVYVRTNRKHLAILDFQNACSLGDKDACNVMLRLQP